MGYWIARPEKKTILLVPLILPSLIWFGISGQLRQVTGPGGFQVIFAAEAKAPVVNFTERDGVSPAFSPYAVTTQMALPAPPEYVRERIAKISDNVLMGDITRRIFYWFTYDNLQPLVLFRNINSFRGADRDSESEFLVFGPQVGIIDCYILDVDFVQRREEEFFKAMQALASMPAEQRRTFLLDSDICTKPFEQSLPAIDALRRLDNARHDEAIVINKSGGYFGMAFRDAIISSLVASLIKALDESG